jgi:hypothetical protein
VLKRIKAQDQDVHSLYQREAVAVVLEAVAGHLGLYPLVEETPAEKSVDPDQPPATEVEQAEEKPGEESTAAKPRRKGDK